MSPQPTTPRKKKMSGHPDPSVTIDPRRSPSLSGKRIAIVGGTDGLGRALARLVAARGAEVTVVGRTFRDEGVPHLRFVKADLSSMREAREVGRSLDASLDVVVLTTGIFASPERQVTSEGIERDLAVSALSRHAILGELVPRLIAAGGRRPRVFVMGFPGAGELGDAADLNAERSYAATRVHMSTVALNEALVLDGVARYPDVGFFGLNPGLVKTNIRANFLGEGSLRHRVIETVLGWFTPSAEAYAERIAPLLLAPELEGRTGVMFGAKGQAILPTDALPVAALVSAADELLRRVPDTASA